MEARARTVVSPQRFSKLNMLHFLGAAVAAQRLAVAMEHKNIPACAYKRQNNRTATSLRPPFQAIAQIMDLDFKIFDSEKLINEVEKSPEL